MSEPKAASPLDAKFARKVRVSRWALLFERLWPRVWLLLGLAGVFLLVSLAGLWPMLSDPVHYVLLGAFALAGVAALLHAVRVPFPSHDEGVRRIERVSGVPHRPASSYEDTITANADDPRTAALWQAHRSRLAAALSRLKVGPPHPRADRQDPVALRGLLVLGVIALLALVGDSTSDRLRSAFRFNSAIALSEARLDAWVTPPSYTGKPPLMLADGARGTGIGGDADEGHRGAGAQRAHRAHQRARARRPLARRVRRGLYRTPARRGQEARGRQVLSPEQRHFRNPLRDAQLGGDPRARRRLGAGALVVLRETRQGAGHCHDQAGRAHAARLDEAHLLGGG